MSAPCGPCTAGSTVDCSLHPHALIEFSTTKHASSGKSVFFDLMFYFRPTEVPRRSSVYLSEEADAWNCMPAQQLSHDAGVIARFVMLKRALSSTKARKMNKQWTDEGG